MKSLYITLALLHLPLFSMEPIDERAPLLTPRHISMDDSPEIADAPDILCTGSRRFFNQKSRRKIACQYYCKSACIAHLNASAMSPMGLIITGQGPLYKYFCCGTTSGCLLPGCCGMFTEFAVPGCLLMYALGVCVSLKDQKSEQRRALDDPHALNWIDEIEIPQDLLKAASDTKEILFTHKDLDTLIYYVIHKPELSLEEQREQEKNMCNTCWPTFGDCIRYFTGFNPTRTSIINRIKKRSRKKPFIRYQIAQYLFGKTIPKDIVKIILTYADLPLVCHVTEKEFIYLLHGLSNKPNECGELPMVCKLYARQILMAKSGWFSFTQSKDYPIPISMKYFDLTQIPQIAAEWYIAFEGPQLYFPYSPKLARYYSFENDPLYQGKNIRESSEQIKHLLELRERYHKLL